MENKTRLKKFNIGEIIVKGIVINESETSLSTSELKKLRSENAKQFISNTDEFSKYGDMEAGSDEAKKYLDMLQTALGKKLIFRRMHIAHRTYNTLLKFSAYDPKSDAVIFCKFKNSTTQAYKALYCQAQRFEPQYQAGSGTLHEPTDIWKNDKLYNHEAAEELRPKWGVGDAHNLISEFFLALEEMKIKKALSKLDYTKSPYQG